MKFNPNEDFNQNVSKLLALLKNMLKNQKIDNKDLNEFFGKKDINLNLCFFTFLPFPMEELDELELDELSEEGFSEYINNKKKDKEAEELKFEITTSDMDFLKKHGIKF
jgi:hypothetical protein